YGQRIDAGCRQAIRRASDRHRSPRALLRDSRQAAQSGRAVRKRGGLMQNVRWFNLARLFGYQTDIELKQDEYRRPPRIRAGEMEMEAQSGMLDWRPRQRWTTKAPR